MQDGGLVEISTYCTESLLATTVYINRKGQYHSFSFSERLEKERSSIAKYIEICKLVEQKLTLLIKCHASQIIREVAKQYKVTDN